MRAKKVTVPEPKKIDSWNKNDTRILIEKLTKLERVKEKEYDFVTGYSRRFMNTRLLSDRVHSHKKLIDAIDDAAARI